VPSLRVKAFLQQQQIVGHSKTWDPPLKRWCHQSTGTVFPKCLTGDHMWLVSKCWSIVDIVISIFLNVVNNYSVGTGNYWQTSSPYSQLQTSQKYAVSESDEFDAIYPAREILSSDRINTTIFGSILGNLLQFLRPGISAKITIYIYIYIPHLLISQMLSS